MRPITERAVNGTIAPFRLAYVPSWTGLPTEAEAIEARVAAANRSTEPALERARRTRGERGARCGWLHRHVGGHAAHAGARS